tara:strand:- start:15128 stop:15487 length:360 start_codon:yes stop_codon:yes gene_type:complete
MELILKTDPKDHIDKYLRVWNGLIGLTKKEFAVAVSLLELHAKISEDGVKEPYLSELLFSTSGLKKLKEDHSLNNSAWYMVKKALIKKSFLSNSEESFSINPKMIPCEELTFKFIVNAG